MTDKKPENRSADWDWTAFFEHVQDPPIRRTLEKALDFQGPGDGRQAVDLGCGAGNDTVHMLAAGFKVLAIDQSEDGLRRLKARQNLPNAKHLKTQKAKFQDMVLPFDCDFINASFALPFCPFEDFLVLWKRIFAALKPGGVFAGHLFGLHDSWNGKVADMNFQDGPDIDRLIEGHTVILRTEIEEDGQDAVGRPKHWHVFHLVIQK